MGYLLIFLGVGIIEVSLFGAVARYGMGEDNEDE